MHMHAQVQHKKTSKIVTVTASDYWRVVSGGVDVNAWRSFVVRRE